MSIRKIAVATALAASLAAAGCEKLPDGTIIIDDLTGCVNLQSGAVRSAHNGCNAAEVKVKFRAPEGTKGKDGAQGPKGAKGDTGGSGAKGADGRTILSGNEAPGVNVGTTGDFYIHLDGDERHIYGPKANNEWGEPLTLTGGGEGGGGTPEPAPAIHRSEDEPDDSDGADGDLWFQIDDGVTTLFGPKADGEWGDGTILNGDDGVDGLSAFEVWQSLEGNNEKNEADFFSAIGAEVVIAYEDLAAEISYDDFVRALADEDFSALAAAIELDDLAVLVADELAEDAEFLAEITGNDGATILSGADAPSDGKVGDFYLQIENDGTVSLFGPKGESGWPVTGTKLSGEDGDDGDPGSQVFRITSPRDVSSLVDDGEYFISLLGWGESNPGECTVTVPGETGPVEIEDGKFVDEDAQITLDGCTNAVIRLERVVDAAL